MSYVEPEWTKEDQKECQEKQFEDKRQRILTEAKHFLNFGRPISSYPQEPSLQEFEAQTRKLLPSKIQQEIIKLKERISSCKNYEKTTFREEMEDRIGGVSEFGMWQQRFRTFKEALAAQSKAHHDQVETVEAAIPYLQEMLKISEEILAEKRTFVQKHVKDAERLTERARKMAEKSGSLHAQIVQLIRKSEREVLREDERRKTIALITAHKNLKTQLDQVTAKLTDYDPEMDAKWRLIYDGFARPSYPMPPWLEEILQRR